MKYLFVFIFVCVFPVYANAHNFCPQSINQYVSFERYSERLNNASEWINDVLLVLDEEGLHRKWIYLMLTESGGNKNAVSKQGAQGAWQLTALIAKAYGCTDRLNPVDSTRAAARYIRKLMNDFKNDERKVLMAYNMGGSNLRKRGKPTNEAAMLSQVVLCLFESNPLSINGFEQKAIDN